MTSPLPLEDVLAFFLKELPFLALPGPPRRIALPPPRGQAPLARVRSVVARAPEPDPVAPTPASPVTAAPDMSPSPPARRATPDGFPTPPPLAPLQGLSPGAEPSEDDDALAPSPWDAGWEPPKSAVGTDPNDLGPDPRTLSLNRPRKKGTTLPTMRAAPPPPPPRKAGPPMEPTHDIVIVPQNPTFRTAEQGVNAVLTYLRTAQFLGLRARRDLPDETVFELAPEAFVHQIFAEGPAPDGPPSVLEATLRVSPKPRPVAYGPAGRMACFSLALVGCRFGKVLEPFKARLQQILYLRPEVFALPHDATRLRAPSAAAPAPIPAFDVQEVDRG